MNQPHRIDVHHHPSLPSYLAMFGEGGRWAPAMRDWSLQKSLDDMERGSGGELHPVAAASRGYLAGRPR